MQPTDQMLADTASLDSIIAAFYQIVSGPAGQPRQWDRDRWCHAPDARILIPKLDADTEQTFTPLTLDQYHQLAQRHVSKGFFEEEIHRITEHFGQMAHVWSTYRWRTDEKEPWQGRGINSIQLYWQNNRWWISSWMFCNENNDTPMPESYRGP